LTKHLWKKGQSGNPAGRPPVLLPEVQKLVDQNRNEVKTIIIKLLNMSEDEFESYARKRLPMAERLFCQCIEKIGNEGDIFRYIKLLEIVLGKIPEDKADTILTTIEMKVLEMFREKLAQKHGPGAIEDSARVD
jgi:hypothetical protein